MKNVLVAIDSFKGCLTSEQACEAAFKGLADAGCDPSLVKCFPLSDGGEGFCNVLAGYLDVSRVEMTVRSPLGRLVSASYLVARDGTAYIESASACGYCQVPPERRNPYFTSSFGLGQMISDAAVRGAKKIVVGLGGTATCDAGVGMLQALGCRFRLSDGSLLPDGEPVAFRGIKEMESSCLDRWSCRVEAWTDTGIQMCGTEGAVYMYGPQKGIDTASLPVAEAWMSEMALLYNGYLADKRLPFVPGSGAAGGIGAALYAFLHSTMKSGAAEVMSLSRFRNALRDPAHPVGLVVTGEGTFDAQTLTGKLPSRVLAEVGAFRRDAALDFPDVLFLCGRAVLKEPDGFCRIVRITPDDLPLEEALKENVAAENLRRTVSQNFPGNMRNDSSVDV